MLKIREAEKSDLGQLLELYTQLTDQGKPSEMPVIDDAVESVWGDICSNKDHRIIVGCVDGKLVSTCVLVIVPNFTHHLRPYALIENVVTDEAHRGKGYATAVLSFAREAAIKNSCYKIMLMTGSKKESTLKFYEKAGYNRHDKTAFIQWLE